LTLALLQLLTHPVLTTPSSLLHTSSIVHYSDSFLSTSTNKPIDICAKVLRNLL
jgi:hypothetical protein